MYNLRKTRHLEDLFDIGGQMLNSEIAAYFFLQNVTMFDNGGLRMFRQFIEEFPAPIKSEKLALSDIYGFSRIEREYISEFIANRIAEISN